MTPKSVTWANNYERSNDVRDVEPTPLKGKSKLGNYLFLRQQLFAVIHVDLISDWSFFNNYAMLSCLYEKFGWLSYVQLSTQPILVNVLRRLADSRRDTAVDVWN